MPYEGRQPDRQGSTNQKKRFTYLPRTPRTTARDNLGRLKYPILLLARFRQLFRSAAAPEFRYARYVYEAACVALMANKCIAGNGNA